MAYIRGNRRDYDTWEKMGNPGWGYDTVLEYFKKSEGNTDEKYAKDNKYHATGGLLKVGNFNAGYDKKKKMMRNGFSEMGYKEMAITNSDKFLGYFDVQATINKGERFGPARAFLASAKERKNLHIIKNAHVTKLKFHTDGSVMGVQFNLGDTNMSASVKKEVVLSAGTIGSPQILKLSGIGPRAELERHGIFVKSNLPVGLNLQDHIVIPFGMGFDGSTSAAITLADIADEMYQFQVHRKGYFAHLGVSEFTAHISTVNDPEYPDIQFHNLAFERQHSGLRFMLELFNLNDEIIESFINMNEKSVVIVWCVIQLNPKSRGRIELASKSPFDKPKIYPNYLHEKEDLDVLVKAMKIMNSFSETKAFSEHEGQLVHVNLPPCKNFEYGSDLYWECYVRHLTTTMYHPVGTCKMGPLSEAETVVDPELKVKGVEGLRVVDASIMPKITSGNTMAPTIMISEMGADFIKKDWQQRLQDEL